MHQSLWLEMLARIQFAFIAGFHILWPPVTIGLSVALFVLEALWLKTDKTFYYRQARFWGRLFLLNFAVGVVSGIPMEFAFGDNWAPLSRFGGGFLGNLLGFEAVLAFMLEAAFLGLMVFGWGVVGRRMHLFATGMVMFGSILSAFWIMAANSWMQTPAGVRVVRHHLIITSYFKAIFNPDLPYSFFHMLIACLIMGATVLGGISAWSLRNRRFADFFLPSLKYAAVALAVLGPLQIFVGDSAGLQLAATQPAKLAAMEGRWRTNPAGRAASWVALCWPAPARQDNAWSVKIPKVGGLIITHHYRGAIKGLRAFPRRDQPPVLIPFYAFRLMVACGFYLALTGLWTVVVWYRGRLTLAEAPFRRRLLAAWYLMPPMAYLAIECGWFTREVGRQPWVIYGLLRTSQAVSHLPPSALIWSLTGFVVFYAAIGSAALVFARRIIQSGPDLVSPVPYHTEAPAPWARGR